VKVAADKPIGSRYQDHFVARIHASAMIVSPNTNAGLQRAGRRRTTYLVPHCGEGLRICQRSFPALSFPARDSGLRLM